MTSPERKPAIQIASGYEPYLPEALVLPKVGDEVEIRFSGECDFRCPNGCDWHWSGATEGVVVRIINHYQINHTPSICRKRQPGRVTCGDCRNDYPHCDGEWGNSQFLAGHPYVIFFPCGKDSGFYAATELVVKGRNDHH